MIQSLDGDGWTVEVIGDHPGIPVDIRSRVFPASVPGCVHLDLLRAGVIADPDDGFGELASSWIGRADWRYTTRVEPIDGLLDHERVDLVCDGLDTIASLRLGEYPVGETADMHLPHRFDVRAGLAGGATELSVTFRGPLAFAEAMEERLGPRPANGDWGTYSYLRKCACNFGWDWGPRVPTAGLWRPVRLHGWTTARIAGVRPLVRAADEGSATLEIDVDVERACGTAVDIRLRATLLGPDGSPVGSVEEGPGDGGPLRVTVERPELWWPRGMGRQPLYRLDVELRHAGRVIDRWSGRLGIRTVALDTAPDEHGSAFTIRVNDRAVFCRGANWIPDGLFPSALTEADYRTRIGQAFDANMNMLRVWGGGIYEDEAFYDTCDELGILVWQDFMFACATYPEDPPYPSLIEAEARHNVTRLAHHPSVVLWCGGNENVIAYETWGFKEQLGDRGWGKAYFFEMLPAILNELDTTRPYWPDSPWSGAFDRHPQDPDHGNRHTWDRTRDGYRELVPRFVSEFGHQAPPAFATFLRAFPDGRPEVDSEPNRHRQRSGGGNPKQYDEPLRECFGDPESFDRWHYLAQVLQSRAVGSGLEWLRANRPRCMGALFWQLNDAWAGHSWSAIDVDGRRKPLWYAVRRAFAPRLLTFQPIAGRMALVLVNDTEATWTAPVVVRRMGLDGTVFQEAAGKLIVEPRFNGRIDDVAELVGAPERPDAEFLTAEIGGSSATWFFGMDRQLVVPPARFASALERAGSTSRLTLTAETLLRDVVLGVDRLDPRAEVDEQLVTILPGRTHVFTVESSLDLDVDSLTTPPVFNCVNRCVGPSA